MYVLHISVFERMCIVASLCCRLLL